MKILEKFLILSMFSLGAAAATALPLSEKQASDAAAHIDQLLGADLAAANLKPNGRIDDATFLRRAYLGIIGRIPTEKESLDFSAESSLKKREVLIDKLVASPGFDSHLFNWTADLLRVQTKQEQFGLGWHVWLRKSLAEDKPWDVLVREMLGATGHAAKDPAVGYYLRDRNMQLDNFSNTMQVFMGRQIGCAQCHDHPFDDWSQFDYYQMAAFGGGLTYRSSEAQETVRRVSMDLKPEIQQPRNFKRGKNGKQRGKNRGVIQQTLKPLFKDFNKNAVLDDAEKTLSLPADYQYGDAEPNSPVAAETLFGEHLENIPPADRKKAFAKWVTAPENPFFTKVIANRLWARVFGRGLQEPIDDWSEESKPVHPEILAFLETTMKGVNYDLRQFSRVLFRTNLFQRECEITESDPGVPKLAQGPSLRRMSAEQLFDSMLVLSNGGISDTVSPKGEYEWQAYTDTIDRLLKAESKDLMVLGEAASQAETAYREAQSETRRLHKQLSEMEPSPARKEVQMALQKSRLKLIKNAKARDPVNMMSNSMEMEMSGGGRKKKNDRTPLRASEHPAPFNPGTLVREFGGSDRTTPSSGDTIPTVPQALALLNDPETDIISGRKSALGQRLIKEETPAGRLNVIFLRLYSREPTSEERERFLPLAKNPISLRDLTRAMLTSNQFIFVQ